MLTFWHKFLLELATLIWSMLKYIYVMCMKDWLCPKVKDADMCCILISYLCFPSCWAMYVFKEVHFISLLVLHIRASATSNEITYWVWIWWWLDNLAKVGKSIKFGLFLNSATNCKSRFSRIFEENSIIIHYCFLPEFVGKHIESTNYHQNSVIGLHTFVSLGVFISF